MSTINDAFINALLADASYVEDLQPNQTPDTLRGLLSPRMTPTLAQYIANNFTVASAIDTPDNPFSGSGFDAVVWRGRPGTPFAGKLYVSMRGTEPLGADLTGADVNLAFTGNAGQQVIDMVNWWLRDTTPEGQTASQYRYARDPVSGFWSFSSYTAAGQGLISDAERIAGVEVNGHSLGGYLASAFTRLLGAHAHVSHTTTFNSAGFTSGSESAFQEIERLIGPGYGVGRFATEAEQTNYFAQHGINFTTNTTWFEQYGRRVALFNEEGTGIPNHLIYKLTDALALANVLAKLDPSLTFMRANALFEAGSNEVAGSIEGVLDGLRRMLIGTGVQATPPGDVSGSASSRQRYHENLAALTATDASGQYTDTTFRALAGQVRIEAVHDAGAARDDFAAMVSLSTGATFSLRLNNPLPNSEGSLALYAKHRTVYEQWLADRSLTAEQREAGQGNFSDAYLRDRADMLNTLAQANIKDQFSYNDPTATGTWLYDDRASNVQTMRGVGGTARLVVFGAAADEVLDGGGAGDRLHGRAGSDTLNGNGGADYLEGGGNDLLSGNRRADLILGGAGNDLLLPDISHLRIGALRSGSEPNPAPTQTQICEQEGAPWGCGLAANEFNWRQAA
jgi:trimeric autotransporter adhesin